jgi:hypothetical protein
MSEAEVVNTSRIARAIVLEGKILGGRAPGHFIHCWMLGDTFEKLDYDSEEVSTAVTRPAREGVCSNAYKAIY